MRFPLPKKSLRISESAVRVFEYKTTTKHWHTRINPGDENNWYYMRTKIIVFPYTRALVSSSYTFLNTVRTRPVHEPGRIEFLIFLIFRSRTIHLSEVAAQMRKKKAPVIHTLKWKLVPAGFDIWYELKASQRFVCVRRVNIYFISTVTSSTSLSDDNNNCF